MLCAATRCILCITVTHIIQTSQAESSSAPTKAEAVYNLFAKSYSGKRYQTDRTETPKLTAMPDSPPHRKFETCYEVTL